MRRQRKFKHPEKVVKNFMYANSIHLIDLMFVFVEDILKKSKILNLGKERITEIVLSTIEFSSGDLALYEGIWKGPGP